MAEPSFGIVIALSDAPGVTYQECIFGALTVLNHAAATSEFTFRFVATLKQDQRNCEVVNRGEIAREQPGQQIGSGELIAVPNTANFMVAVIWGKL